MTNHQQNNTSELACVILAAGMGTRMCSDTPKVMHKVAGFPMVHHVVKACEAAKASKIIVVVAPGMDDVREAVKPHCCVVQEKPLGTGDAAKAALSELEGFNGSVLVAFGDTPLLTAESISDMVSIKAVTGANMLVSGFEPEEKGRIYKYGRLILKEEAPLLEEIVEAADATPEQLEITYFNGGIMLFNNGLLGQLLSGLTSENAQGEYYLTDCVKLANEQGNSVAAIPLPEDDVRGVNTRAQLAEVDGIMQGRMRYAHMTAGVTMRDPSTVYLCSDTVLAKDVVIEPHVVFGPGVTIGEGTEIRAFSHIEQATVASNAKIGPYARLRPGAEIASDAHIGNFVEIKKSKIAEGAKVNHLSYIGDTSVGAKTNIGAGTITCNYDGYTKAQTIIGAGAFIGSNTIMIAPVEVADGAITAAGSVITKAVDANALAVSRAPQKTHEGWATNFRAKKEKAK